MQATKQTRVKGYSHCFTAPDLESRLEILFALTEAGSIFCTPAQPYSNTFDTKNWIETKLKLDDVQALNAEFIGNYDIAI